MKIMKMISSIKNVLFVLFIWIILYSVLSLDIPFEVLSVIGEYHCFNEFRRCFSLLEYCHSDFKECRPCSKDVCSKDEEEIPLMCRLNCTITGAILNGKTQTNDFVNSHPYVWFVLMLVIPPASIILSTLIVVYKSTLKQRLCQLRFIFGKRRNVTDEEISMIVQKPGNYKATHRDICEQVTEGSQTKTFCNKGPAPYCEGKFKGTCVTSEDSNVVIQTSQAPNAYTGGLAGTTAVQLSTVVTTHDEQDKEITQSKIGQLPDMSTDMNLDLTSAPLNWAPALDCLTFENDAKI